MDDLISIHHKTEKLYGFLSLFRLLMILRKVIALFRHFIFLTIPTQKLFTESSKFDAGGHLYQTVEGVDRPIYSISR